VRRGLAARSGETRPEGDAIPRRREAIVGEVLARSPELQAMAARVRARVAEARSQAALPPPMAMAQLWQAPLHAPFVHGEGSMLMLGIQQTFPPGASLDAGARTLVEQARGEAALLAVREREISSKVALLLVDLRESTQLLTVYREHHALADRVVEAARARRSTGGALVDEARAEREAAQQGMEELSIEGDLDRARADLNVLLDRRVEAPVGAVDDEGLELPAGSVEPLIVLAREQRAELRAARSMQRREAARVAGAEASRSPMYTVGLNYGLSRPGEMADTWGATFAMTLPWLSAGAAAQVEAGRAEQAAAGFDLQAAEREIDREVAAAWQRARGARRQLSLIDDRLLPAATRAAQVSRAGFAAGQAELSALVEATHEARDAALAHVRARAALDRALIELERAVGGRLP
jgi:outer membrane protein TolC